MQRGLVAALVFVFALPGAAFAATNVSARFSSEGGYGRIVLSSPEGLPQHSQNVTAGILLLTFDAPVTLDPEMFSRKLPNYIAGARQDADGRTLRLALASKLHLKSRYVENSLYLDLLPQGWGDEAPPLPADVLARLAAAEKARKEAEAAEKRAQKENLAELSVRAAHADGVTRIFFDWNKPVTYKLAHKGGIATLTFSNAAHVALSGLRVDPPPYLTNITSTVRNGRLSVAMQLAPDVVIKDFREGPGVVVDLKLPPKKVSVAEKKLEEAKAAEAAAAAAAKIPPLKIEILAGGDETTFIFPWQEPTGAAVFTRGENLWMVFDRTAKFDLSALDAVVSKNLSKPQIAESEDGSAFIFTMSGPKKIIGATQDGTSWRISLGNNEANTARPIIFSRHWTEAGQGVVALDLRNASRIVEMKDPMVGDTLLIATAPGPAQSIQNTQSFIEFQALKTAHGVAVVRVADDLNIDINPKVVLISRHKGLVLSDNSTEENRRKADAAYEAAAEMDFAAWRGQGDFTAEKQAHLARLVALPADTQNVSPRMAFARFLLANGLGPEALIQLDLAGSENPAQTTTAIFGILKGTAEYMSHRYAEAVLDLSTSVLSTDPYAALWRGLARVELGQFEAARSDFRSAVPALAHIDPALAAKVYIEAARAALADNDPEAAKANLGLLREKDVPADLEMSARLVHAGLLEADNKINEAAAAYDAVAASGETENAIRAKFRKAVMLHRMKKMDDNELIARLDDLSLQWRGGDIERMILTRIAELQLSGGNVPEALVAMRHVTISFPNNDEAREMGARMSDIFADYFMSPQADKMEPVQALSFYYRFQSLTPIGEKGDRLIRHLAEKLVDVDLLPQAAALLTYQIDNRLSSGMAKAQVAGSLAKIYLLDNAPQKALDVLHDTRQNLLPDELSEERRLIQVRAFAALQKYDLALDLLSDLPGEAARKLESDVLWEAQRWTEAGRAAQLLAGKSPEKASEKLTKEQRFYVMRSAVSYALGHDNEALEELHNQFAGSMAETEDAAGFEVVSDPISTDSMAFRDQVARIAAVNTIQRFVQSLKAPEKLASISGTGATAVN